MTTPQQIQTQATVCKMDAKLGLVFGYAIVCNIWNSTAMDYQPYFDTQGDHIPDEAMLSAALDFSMGDRNSRVMHMSEDDGKVVFVFPLTRDIAEALGFIVPMTGLLIAIKPSAEVFEQFQSGYFSGFSIGGSLISAQEM